MTPPLTALVEALRPLCNELTEAEKRRPVTDDTAFCLLVSQLRAVRAALSAFEAEPQDDEAARLRKAIQDYLDGNYENPRRHRPGRCRHGTWYYDPCEQCIDAHFDAALAQPLPLPPETRK